jgi:hypothetical protein
VSSSGAHNSIQFNATVNESLSIVVTGPPGAAFILGVNDRAPQASLATHSSWQLDVNTNKTVPITYPGETAVFRVPANRSGMDIDLLLTPTERTNDWEMRVYFEGATPTSNCTCNSTATVPGSTSAGCAFASARAAQPQCLCDSGCAYADAGVLSGCSTGLDLLKYAWFNGYNSLRMRSVRSPSVGQFIVAVREKPSSSATSPYSTTGTTARVAITVAAMCGSVDPSQTPVIDFGTQVSSAIDVPGDVDDFALFVPAGTAALLAVSTDSPRCYIDVDVLDETNTIVSGAASDDQSQVVVSSNPTARNITIRIRATGHATDSYNSRTGDYKFTVWSRRIFNDTLPLSVGSAVLTELASPGNRKMLNFNLPSQGVGSRVQIVVGEPSNSNLYTRIGIFVNDSAANTSDLACRCHLPAGLPPGTPGSTCGFHSVTDVHPWCFVNSDCMRMATYSSSSIYEGHNYTDFCIPGHVLVGGNVHPSRRWSRIKKL